MNNITFKSIILIATFFINLLVNAQYYQFSHLTESYVEFTDGEQLNAPQITSQYFDTIYTDFEINVLGESTNELVIGESFIWWERAAIGEATQIFPLWYLSQISPSTEISYKTTGVNGNRILKVQYKDLGFLNVNDPNYFTNYQIWFYENEDKLEFHYGPRNIVSTNAYIDDGIGSSCPGALILLADIYNEDDLSPESAHVFNTPDEPLYEQFFSSSSCALVGMPYDGDVYQFFRTNIGLVETELYSVEFLKTNTNFISILSKDELINEIKVISIDGKKIESIEHLNTNQHTIDLTNKASSILIFEVISKTGRVVRKKIKF